MQQTSDNEIAIINREHWLTELVRRLEPILKDQGKKLPKWRISCSFPVSRPRPRATGGHRIGECWACEQSGDGTREILISPTMGHSETLDERVKIASTVLHEMCHAVLPPEVGHKAPFAKLAKSVGLEGKPTSTEPGEKLAKELKKITDEIGPYPHAKIDATNYKKQGTRLLKVLCPECGYTIRVTRTWLDEAGFPICPICQVEFVEPTDEEITENPLVLTEQVVEYSWKGSERYQIRMIKRARKIKWNVIDFGEQIGYFAEGEAAIARTIPADTREDAINIVEAIDQGLLDPAKLDPEVDDIDVDLDEVPEDTDEDWADLQEEDEDEEEADHKDSVLTEDELIEYNRNEREREAR